MVLQTWGDVIIASLQQVWVSVASFLPFFIGAVIVFVIGWIVAMTLGKIVEQVVKALRIDHFLAKLEVEKAMERAGWRLNSGAFLGGLVKWFLIVAFLLASVNILGLTQVSDFLRDVLLYLPNVAIAALILIIAAVVADTAERLIRGSAGAMGHRGSIAGVVSRWAIWIFAIVAVLLQLGVAAMLVQTVITGLIAALALGAGLAFGLGGKDAATDMIRKAREEMRM